MNWKFWQWPHVYMTIRLEKIVRDWQQCTALETNRLMGSIAEIRSTITSLTFRIEALESLKMRVVAMEESTGIIFRACAPEGDIHLLRKEVAGYRKEARDEHITISVMRDALDRVEGDVKAFRHDLIDQWQCGNDIRGELKVLLEDIVALADKSKTKRRRSLEATAIKCLADRSRKLLDREKKHA